MSNLSNLPPGVSDHDIPGNRPEDVLWDRAWDKLAFALDSFGVDVDAYLSGDGSRQDAMDALVTAFTAFVDIVLDGREFRLPVDTDPGER